MAEKLRKTPLEEFEDKLSPGQKAALAGAGVVVLYATAGITMAAGAIKDRMFGSETFVLGEPKDTKGNSQTNLTRRRTQ